MKSQRLIVASAVSPVLFAYVYFLSSSWFLVLLVIVSMLSMREFYTMYKVPRMYALPGIFMGGILFYVACRATEYFFYGLVISLFFLLLLRLIAAETPSGSMSDIGPLGVGFFYISGFLSFQWFLRDDDFGAQYILFLYVTVWLADSAAYYIGTYLGKNRLYPAVSPNKTFEGFFGSILGGATGAFIMKIVFNIHDISIMKSIIIGAVLGTAAVFGDLIESMFKRDAGVKDSSNLIPGHGGMLDKIDGLLVAAPLLYFVLRYL